MFSVVLDVIHHPFFKNKIKFWILTIWVNVIFCVLVGWKSVFSELKSLLNSVKIFIFPSHVFCGYWCEPSTIVFPDRNLHEDDWKFWCFKVIFSVVLDGSHHLFFKNKIKTWNCHDMRNCHFLRWKFVFPLSKVCVQELK
jgi:hypothetical protein